MHACDYYFILFKTINRKYKGRVTEDSNSGPFAPYINSLPLVNTRTHACEY